MTTPGKVLQLSLAVFGLVSIGFLAGMNVVGQQHVYRRRPQKGTDGTSPAAEAASGIVDLAMSITSIDSCSWLDTVKSFRADRGIRGSRAAPHCLQRAT